MSSEILVACQGKAHWEATTDLKALEPGLIMFCAGMLRFLRVWVHHEHNPGSRRHRPGRELKRRRRRRAGSGSEP